LTPLVIFDWWRWNHKIRAQKITALMDIFGAGKWCLWGKIGNEFLPNKKLLREKIFSL
jgi:hypothetical protein